MENNIIVSVTSYGSRLKYIDKVIKSIMDGDMIPYKIYFCVYKGDINLLTANDTMMSYIKNDKVELKLVDTDIKPHKKYYYVMLDYPNNPIVTIDDDVIYPKDFLYTLNESYKKYPNCVSARRVHLMKKNDNGYLPYKNWKKEFHGKDPSFDIFATGVGGVLYPPNVFSKHKPKMDEIMKSLCVDDVYLHYLECENSIKIVYAENNMNHPTKIDSPEVTSCALMNVNWSAGSNGITPNDAAMNLFFNKK